MPPIAGLYTWKQTPLYIHISIPLNGTSPKSVDIYVSRHFVKVNFRPYLTEIDLLHGIEDSSAAQTAVVKNGTLNLRLTKLKPQAWKSLTVSNLGKSALIARRSQDMEEKRARDIATKEDAQVKKSENRRRAVRVQMKVDETEHSTLDNLKAEEKRKAEEETYKVLDGLRKAQPSASTSKATAAPAAAPKTGAGAAKTAAASHHASKYADYDDDEDVAPLRPAVPDDDNDDIDDTDIMQSLARDSGVGDTVYDEAAAGSQDSGGGEIWDAETEVVDPTRGAGGSGPNPTPLPDPEPIEEDEDDNVVYIPAPRQTGGVVKMAFTKRFFKTPMRESKRQEEEDWIAKNQRGLLNNPDARDIAERDPFWLKGKGDDFFKAKDFSGAINAYSAALQAQPKMFAALSNRAAAFLAIKRFDECISDASNALEIVQSETKSVTKCLKLWVRRGTALCGKGDYVAALEDYRRVGEHLPKDPKIQTDIRTIERIQACATLKKTGDDFFREKKLEEACAKYAEALELDSGFVSCYTNRAAAHLAQQMFAECEADASSALVLMGVETEKEQEELNASEQSPADGNATSQSERRRKHVPLSQKALTGPVPAEGTKKYVNWLVNIYVKRGVARAQQGRLEQALADYRSAAEADPTNAQVKKDLSKLRKRVKKAKVAAAAEKEAESVPESQ